jgi:acylphosphatase
MERFRIRYAGRVQGVGFRATARALARQYPITGWVRNEPDGSVILEAQGLPEQLEAFAVALEREMSRYISSQEKDRTMPLQEGAEHSFEIRA